ncbi:MAG: 4-hydroxyphenylpyruvate dioxygenase [Candidatus Thermoplasmatota archaeon]|jgi:4-hydroxyphenylpyruvate dioxygenase|nr:4-hydroxyphenylpyruvate dioxygenase [Candidatus Thermoplasmatota archaeon]MCL5785306.1 4-hydroxyphenylpyruvate dioxygenase [Candidatus Thermoplasmatota archaeon]
MDDAPYLAKVDSVEFLVGSAKQWAYFHEKAMGFSPLAYAGPETGVRDKVSYLMKQGDVKVIFTSYLNPDSPIAEHVRTHGDGVKDISIEVPEIDRAVVEIGKRGMIKPGKISTQETHSGKMRVSVIPTYGETVHTLKDFSDSSNTLPSGFEPIEGKSHGTGIGKIDHIVGNVDDRKMDSWAQYYIRGLGFEQLMSFEDKDISTKYSALRSKVVHYNDRSIIFPINEPALGLKKSQIQEYLDYYKTPGVQHVALHTDDIIRTVTELKERGIEFLYTPGSYYDALHKRVDHIDEDLDTLQKLNILVDFDEFGYMLQIFTKPMGDRPTFFYEIIERKGGRSFGKGNFKALFEAIETEQNKRGNL